MNLRRVYNVCACLLVALAITSYVSATIYIGEPALLMGVFILPAIVVGWVISSQGKLLLPRWLVNAMLLFAMAYAASLVTYQVAVRLGAG